MHACLVGSAAITNGSTKQALKVRILTAAYNSRVSSVLSFFRWPLPALLAWAGSWVLYGVLLRLDVAVWLSLSIATLAGAMLSVFASTFWRRLAIAAGFPLSLLISGSVALPAWAWLLPASVPSWLLCGRTRLLPRAPHAPCCCRAKST